MKRKKFDNPFEENAGNKKKKKEKLLNFHHIIIIIITFHFRDLTPFPDFTLYKGGADDNINPHLTMSVIRMNVRTQMRISSVFVFVSTATIYTPTLGPKSSMEKS